MGFDINGIKPKNEKGEYFRNNVWWWRKLWLLIGAQGEELYRIQNKLGSAYPEDFEDIRHTQFIENWRDLNNQGHANDGVTYKKEYHKHVIDTIEWCLKEKDKEHMNDFFDWIDEEYGDKANDYPFTWENAEDFLKFLKANEGFEIW